jgi:hypothetical protein
LNAGSGNPSSSSSDSVWFLFSSRQNLFSQLLKNIGDVVHGTLCQFCEFSTVLISLL